MMRAFLTSEFAEFLAYMVVLAIVVTLGAAALPN